MVKETIFLDLTDYGGDYGACKGPVMSVCLKKQTFQM